MYKLLVLTAIGLLLFVATEAKAWYPSRSQAKHIIYTVFPPATEALMYSIASCETVGFTDFHNESSDARGLFQVIPYWHRDANPWKLLNDPWYNARYAYRMSNRGYSLSPWYASYGCWR